MGKQRDMRIPLEVVVSRRRWGRGNPDTSALRIEANDRSILDGVVGKQCCLGFVARKCGLKVSDITAVRDFAKLDTEQRDKIFKHLPKMFHAKDLYLRQVHSELTRINDEERITEPERERQLVEKGLEAGIKFIFTP